MHFLKTTLEDFFCQKIKLPSPFGEGPWPCLNPVCERYQQKCITISQIESTQRKENRPVAIFACTCGFTYSRKGPDGSYEDAFRRDTVLSYGAVWEAKLKELWLNPTITRHDIAHFLGMSETNVVRRALKLGLATPRISPHPSKGKPRLIRDILWYRTQWLALVEATPEKAITSLRVAAPSLYKWLYDHDQEWLIAHRPASKPWRRRGGPKKDVTFQILKVDLESQDEVSRDAITAEAVKNTAQQILCAPGQPKRVSRAAIKSHISQLDWLIRKPDQVPLTIQALEEVIETREEYAIRRIWWFKQQYQKEQIIPSRREFLGKSNFLRLIHLPSVKQALEMAVAELSFGL